MINQKSNKMYFRKSRLHSTLIKLNEEETLFDPSNLKAIKNATKLAQISTHLAAIALWEKDVSFFVIFVEKGKISDLLLYPGKFAKKATFPKFII